MTSKLSDQFSELGFVGSSPIFNEAECQSVIKTLRKKKIDSSKGYFAAKNLLGLDDLNVAQFTPILSRVTSLIGSNVLLWGSVLIDRVPGQVHPWHTDIETADDSIRSVSVWIGLEGTTEKSALKVISHSHLWGKSLQETQSLNSIRRNEATLDQILLLAQERNPLSCFQTPCQRNGEALFFDGRIWHGSHNEESIATRTALLLQFISTDSVIRVPDSTVFDWPFQYLNDLQPVVYLINGSDSDLRNKVMKTPPRFGHPGMPALETSIQPIRLPVPENPETGWIPVSISRGPCSQLNDLAYHASVLNPGCTPHPPHQHNEDEILLVLDGEVEIQLVNEDSDQRINLQKGSFSYYPAGQIHTLHNKSSKLVHYLMFKWYSNIPCDSREYLKTTVIEHHSLSHIESEFQTKVVLDGSTGSLQKFHAHYSTLKPGAGYSKHADAYDVAIVTLRGKIETLNQEVGPNNVIFYAAGDLHGIKNVGKEFAEYLVLEFHGVPTSLHGGDQPELQKILPDLRIHRRLLKPVEQLAKKFKGIFQRAKI